MGDVPLLFGILSNEFMAPRKSVDPSQQTIANIYDQLCSIGYLNDIGSNSVPSTSGKGGTW